MAHRIIFRQGRHLVLSHEGACVAACEDFAAANELLRRLDGAGVSEALFANNKGGKIPTTVEDIRRGSIARAQARTGRSVPTWVANEQLWTHAQKVAARLVANTSDEYFPAAAAIYRTTETGGLVRDAANKDGGWDAHVPLIVYKGTPSVSTFSHPEHTKGERVPVSKVVAHFKSRGVLANEFNADTGLDTLPNEDAAPAAVPAAFPTGSGSAREVEAHFSRPMRGQSGAYWQRLGKKKGAK